MSWDKLTMGEKALYMRSAIKNGYRDMESIKEKYNEFAEGGIVESKERNFDTYLEEVTERKPYLKEDLKNPKDYDYKANYDKDPKLAWETIDNPHFSDYGKLPNHPTFSEESKYSNPKQLGGSWIDNKDFNHSDYTMEHSDDTINYLSRNDEGSLSYYKEGVVLPTLNVTPKRSYTDLHYTDKGWRYDTGGNLMKNIHLVPQGFPHKNKDNINSIINTSYMDNIKNNNNFKINNAISDEEIINETIRLENPNNKGWVSPADSYISYPSAEGGTHTIGPGVKLNKDVKFKPNTLYPVEEVHNQVINHYRKSEKGIKKAMNTKFGDGTFESLPKNYIKGLIDIDYQTNGVRKKDGFVGLKKAMLDNDTARIIEESKVYFKNRRGEKQFDERRHNERKYMMFPNLKDLKK